MTRSTYNRHRIFAVCLLLVLLFSVANYYLDLDFFGRGAKGILLLAMAVIVVYGAFFSPTREDMREHGGGGKLRRNQ